MGYAGCHIYTSFAVFNLSCHTFSNLAFSVKLRDVLGESKGAPYWVGLEFCFFFWIWVGRSYMYRWVRWTKVVWWEKQAVKMMSSSIFLAVQLLQRAVTVVWGQEMFQVHTLCLVSFKIFSFLGLSSAG